MKVKKGTIKSGAIFLPIGCNNGKLFITHNSGRGGGAGNKFTPSAAKSAFKSSNAGAVTKRG